MTITAVSPVQAVGSHDMAETLIRWSRKWIDHTPYEWRHNPPAGWEYLGCGANRIAFRAPDGFVYKVAKTLYGEEANRNEYRNLKNHACEFWAPAVNIFTTEHSIPVVCMEYVEDDGTDLSDAGKALLWNFPILDMHEANIRVINGMPVVVDAGE